MAEVKNPEILKIAKERRDAAKNRFLEAQDELERIQKDDIDTIVEALDEMAASMSAAAVKKTG